MHRLSATLGPRARRLRAGPLAQRPPPSPQTRRAPISISTSLLGRDDVHRRPLRPNHPGAQLPSTTSNNTCSARCLWSPADLAAEAAEESPSQPPSPLHLPPIGPAAASAASLIEPSTLEALTALPECQSAIDILNGEEGALEPSRVNEALSNLQRARDILQSMPELNLATFLLEANLRCLCGEFEAALEGLSRYEHLKASSIDAEERTMLQFLKAQLMINSGRFAHALSEYECLLEDMEREAEEQVRLLQERGGGDNTESPLPVIHAASALTGVGASQLLSHIRDGSGGNAMDADEGEILESIETATDMLLESRKDALLSPKHSQLAVDLGLAAAVSLTNLGVAHFLLHNDKEQSMACWRRGLETLDSILEGAMRSATVIPGHKHLCMEGVRARLYCNIAWALLGSGPLDNVEDETLKSASEAAKKALDIYDELMNCSKVLRGGSVDMGNSKDDGECEEAADDATTQDEWEQILKEKAEEQQVPPKPNATPLSSLWAAHHQAESARALGLVAQCYAGAGAAVTSEGLFQSALDASASYPLGQNLKLGGSSAKGVALSSPSLGVIARDVRLGYALLCDNWDKRKADAERLRADAHKIEDEGVLRGFARGKDGGAKSISGLASSLWLFSPLDFD
ncbi:hypothetical protein ACHAXT_010999 [Thalassiosira profunda]